MIRKLMASTAMLALITAGSLTAQAQTQPAQTEDPAVVQQEGAAPEMVAESEETLVPEEPTLATAFIGKPVYSSEDPESDNIGDVNDLIVSDDGTITHAVVGVGGFLGIGEKDVAVPFDDLQVVEQEGEIRLVYAATKEQLETADEFDRTAYDPSARFAEEQAAMQPDPAAPADTMAPEDDLAAQDPNAPPAEQDMVAADPAAEAAATIAEADATDPAEAATAEDGETFMSFNADQIRASTLIGQEVYGAEGESIGEISDLVLQEDGETRAAIIDVGGFLGVGEKSVAIPFEQIEVQQEEGGEPRVVVAMSREQLEQAPAFDVAALDDSPAIEQTEAGAEADIAVDPAAEQEVAADTNPAPATEADLAADADVVAGEERVGFELATQDLSADDLIGTAVYGANEENIGEVGDVLFDQSGEIAAVVIDVGGFLGIGEKPVAVTFDALNVQKDGSGDVQLMINASQEQLEGAPSYEAEQAAVQ